MWPYGEEFTLATQNQMEDTPRKDEFLLNTENELGDLLWLQRSKKIQFSLHIKRVHEDLWTIVLSWIFGLK